MSDLDKGRIFQHKTETQKLVRITKLIDGSDGLPPIVIFKEVDPDYAASTLLNTYILGFEFKKGAREVYLERELFQQIYQWFSVDEETLGKIRAGWYDSK